MNWPQYTYLALTCVGLGMVIAKHGEPDKHNAVSTVLTTCLVLWLLYMGGFFGARA